MEVLAEPKAAAPAAPAQGKSPTRIALARLRRDRTAMICLGIFLFFVLMAIFAPLLAALEGQDSTTLHQDLIDDYGYPTIGPTAEHWFGIEPRLGRDLFARWVYGARPSLIIGTLATVVSTLIGVLVGLVAGFAGGWLDRILSWLIDFVLSLPQLLFAIAVPATFAAIFLGSAEGISAEQTSTIRFYSLIFVLSVFGWAGLARLIRGEVLSLREREFVQAARVLGVPTWQILGKELLPNLVGPIIVSVSMALPAYMVTEAGLTVLGVGLTEPTPSWGVTISAATNYYRADPLYLWLPVIGITLLVLVLSLLGDSIRDAFDPRTRR
ncbi:peptide ABC transporter permease [Actinoplanes ianthinogenes]|uniref:Peptide ABC transporter permease n=1 Tax=Actinoplanes ianthinogenes TaxID=122358 RepID=A0ABM7LS87_9ACTN|nr:ABC transporter permease [Actinoplanes ianthinogenes]BCJ42074.1 peptide ABC transporter permease [Actinoplanes ianthinogenes]GGR37841.1 peptide ABC transporter permease [Actinoplanes ianthinogenes]